MGYPKEDRNTLSATATAEIIDLLCEGEIEGPATASLSFIYLEDTPVTSVGGDYNFSGVTLDYRVGESHENQAALPTPDVGNTSAFNTEIVKATPIIKTIGDKDTDHLIINIRIPSLNVTDTSGSDRGDIEGTTVRLEVAVKANGESVPTWVTIAEEIVISGKCVVEYSKDFRIENLTSNFGAGPWDVRVTRITNDSESSALNNKTFWYSYTTLKEVSLTYADSAMVSVTVDAKHFGNKIPARTYHIKGLKIQIPSNYNPVTRLYNGSWDGTFTTAYSNNPAWCYYDILNNTRYGLGIDANYIDKWELYKIAQYCDGLVDDGYGSTEPRFTYNGVIGTKREANHILSTMVSNFRAMPYWASGYATAAADRPIDATRLITSANVKDGEFVYRSSDIRSRYTSVNVSWNDPDDMYRPAIESVDHPEGIDRYGWSSTDIVAVGCTSRGQARRLGKWFMYTNYYETETVSFICGWDMAGLRPGEIILVQDEYAADARFSGRIISTGTTDSSVSLDSSVTIETSKTYELYITSSMGNVEHSTVTNAPGTYTTLDVDESFESVPLAHSTWVLSSTSIVPREFRVLGVKEEEVNEYVINAVEHNSNKFALIEQDIYFDEDIYTNVPTGIIDPPTSLSGVECIYKKDLNWYVKVLLSWEHSPDTRTQDYEVQWKSTEEDLHQPTTWTLIGEVPKDGEPSIIHDKVSSGNRDYRVRALAEFGRSGWATYNMTVSADPDAPPDVTGLQIVGGGTTFSGCDCEFEWDSMDYSTVPGGLLKNYYVEIRTTADVLLRSMYVEYNDPEDSGRKPRFIYTYEMNQDDNSGAARREFVVKVWANNIHDKKSVNAAVATFENPAPSMAGLLPTTTALFQALKIDWEHIAPTDTDMSKYLIYIDDFNPPTTARGSVGKDTTHWIQPDLEPGVTYFVQIVPCDLFGAGIGSMVDNVEPVYLSQDSIIGELTERLNITDNIGTASGTITKLYDGNKLSNGIDYIIGNYVDYDFPIDQLQDRLSFWCSSSVKVYVSYIGRDDTRHYLRAKNDGTHELDDEGRMIEASSWVDAALHYWTADAGNGIINRALFPQRLVAGAMRLHFLSPTTMYEIIFCDQVIAEQIIANELGAISANLGAISAGTLQSQNWSSVAGMFIDLDDGKVQFGGSNNPSLKWNIDDNTLEINALVHFQSQSDGYMNLGDRPDSLNDISPVEATKLVNIEDGADITGNHQAATIYGQGNLATQNTVSMINQVIDKSLANLDSTANTKLLTIDPYADVTNTVLVAAGIENGADKTSTHTSYSTNYVGGIPASTVAGWRHVSNATYIDGGMIFTNTIVANKIIGGEITGHYIHDRTGSYVFEHSWTGYICRVIFPYRGGPLVINVSYKVKLDQHDSTRVLLREFSDIAGGGWAIVKDTELSGQYATVTDAFRPFHDFIGRSDSGYNDAHWLMFDLMAVYNSVWYKNSYKDPILSIVEYKR